MNNKGFTLIEIIAVIGLLALIATMVGSNLVGMNQRQNAKNYENYKQTIANAACLYFESKGASMYSSPTEAINGGSALNRSACVGNICYVSTGALIEAGYLANDLKDPTTQEAVTSTEIAIIRYVNGVKTCCYDRCE